MQKSPCDKQQQYLQVLNNMCQKLKTSIAHLCTVPNRPVRCRRKAGCGRATAGHGLGRRGRTQVHHRSLPLVCNLVNSLLHQMHQPQAWLPQSPLPHWQVPMRLPSQHQVPQCCVQKACLQHHQECAGPTAVYLEHPLARDTQLMAKPIAKPQHNDRRRHLHAVHA